MDEDLNPNCHKSHPISLCGEHTLSIEDFCPFTLDKRKNGYVMSTFEALLNKGWTWIGGEYLGATTKVHIRCDKGHKVWKTPHIIKGKNGCARCSGNHTDKQVHTEELNEIITGRGGTWVSGEYEGGESRLTIRCSGGYTWQPTVARIKARDWCPHCSGNVRDPYYHERELLLMITERSGKWISGEYTGCGGKITVECLLGHQWTSRADVIKRGCWCPRCSGNCRDITYHTEIIRDIIAKRSAVWVGGEYVNRDSRITIDCKHGHMFEIAACNLKAGHWCAKCYGNSNDKEMHTQRLLDIIKYREGTWIDGEYVNSHIKITIKCKEGHDFMMAPDCIKNEQWCPQCKEHRSERTCRSLIEQMTGCKFPKTKMQEFIVPSTGRKLELDGYCEALAMGFEYQGKQHYEHLERFHKTVDDFQLQQKRDQLKRRYCHEYGVLLIEVPYTCRTEQSKYDCIVDFFRDNDIDYIPVDRYESQ